MHAPIREVLDSAVSVECRPMGVHVTILTLVLGPCRHVANHTRTSLIKVIPEHWPCYSCAKGEPHGTL